MKFNKLAIVKLLKQRRFMKKYEKQCKLSERRNKYVSI